MTQKFSMVKKLYNNNGNYDDDNGDNNNNNNKSKLLWKYSILLYVKYGR